MKTRVITKNNKFYPQYKFLFFWRFFQELDECALDCGHPMTDNVSRDTLEEAVEVCERRSSKVVWESHSDVYRKTPPPQSRGSSLV